MEISIPDYYERDTCRFCGFNQLQLYLDLGRQAPSNSFIAPGDVEQEEKFPLQVYLCTRCGLSQLTGVISAHKIFNDYQYLSSTSKALVEHFGRLTKFLIQTFHVGKTDGVLDIGANDGVMLGNYPKDFTKLVGVEPSKIATITQKKGFKIFKEFFTSNLARQIKNEVGPMAIITATNVFAHIDNIGEVVDGVRILLSEKGVFIIEAPYVVNMVDQNFFDTIYHEHLCYLGVTPLVRLMADHGLEIFNVEPVNFGASGPAIRVFCQKAGGVQPISPSVNQFLESESKWGITELRRYLEFADRIFKLKDELLQIMMKIKKTGARIGAYGAPAKGNTLLNTYQINHELITEGVAETNPVKIGKLTPGTHLSIISEESFLAKKAEYALLLSWNYLDYFLKSSNYIKQGGRFIVPLPLPTVMP